ncbi:hypothetical protein MBLNU457_1842t1 [Dothideomycetes sp. NU457]
MAPLSHKHTPPTPTRQTRQKPPVKYFNKRTSSKKKAPHEAEQAERDESSAELSSDEESTSRKHQRLLLKIPKKSESGRTAAASVEPNDLTINVAPKHDLKRKRSDGDRGNVTKKSKSQSKTKAKKSAPAVPELSPEEKAAREKAEQERLSELAREKEAQEEAERQRARELAKEQEALEQARLQRTSALAKLEELSESMQGIDAIGLPGLVPERLSEVLTYLEAFLTNASATKVCSKIIQHQIDKFIGYIDRGARADEWADSGLVDAINILYAILSTREDTTSDERIKDENEQLRQEIIQKDDLLEKQRLFHEAQESTWAVVKLQLESKQVQVRKGDVISELQKQLIATHAKSTKLFTENMELKDKHDTQVERLKFNHKRELDNAKKSFELRRDNMNRESRERYAEKDDTIKALKVKMKEKEKAARNAKTEKLQTLVDNCNAQLSDQKKDQDSLDQELRAAKATITQKQADLDNQAITHQQELLRQKKLSTLKSMRLLLCSISKTRYAEELTRHETELRFDAYRQLDDFRKHVSLNVAAMNRNRRFVKELQVEHSQEVLELEQQISSYHDEVNQLKSALNNDDDIVSPRSEQRTPSSDSTTEDGFVEADAGNTDEDFDNAEDSGVGSEGHEEAHEETNDSGMGGDDDEEVEDSGVGTGSPGDSMTVSAEVEDSGAGVGFSEDSIGASEEAGDTAVEGSDNDMEEIEDFESAHEGTSIALGAEEVDMEGEPDSEETAAEEDMRTE